MRQSCLFEINEENKATIAQCINFTDAVERQDCRVEAAENKKETKSECFAQEEARLDVCVLLAEDRYDPDPLTGESLTGESIVFVDPDTIGHSNMPNSYFSLVPGRTQVLRAGEEGGEVTGERDELVCVGDSLDILDNPDCGIDDVDKLREQLCRMSPDVFCMI